MYCRVLSGAPLGVDGILVLVEVDMAPGLPIFNIVGSIGSDVRESKERVGVALKNAGFRLPASRITVNLSPADVKKDGTAFDLAIAVGLLSTMECFLKGEINDTIFLGELGLDGEIRKIRGVLPIVRKAAESGVKKCIVPSANVMEAAVVPGIIVMGASNITQVVEHLRDKSTSKLEAVAIDAQSLFKGGMSGSYDDFSQIIGQETGKRAAKIAAAGFHNLLMTGPPGVGKSMIAKCIPGIMPPLSLEESLEITSVKSVAGLMEDGESLETQRPFQCPHHTISQAAFLGGCMVPRPGIISLAHRGVLFMDEFPEFKRGLLDSLRQPLEEKRINIARVNGSVSYPANFMLVCAMNPCPCGYYPDTNRCHCTEVSIRRYVGKISGPILERIDLCVELLPIDIGKLHGAEKSESSAQIRKQVMRARKMQQRRFENTPYNFNSDISSNDVEKYCVLGDAQRACIEEIYDGLGLSARTYHRILKVARTIADLEGEENITEAHLYEAAGFRTPENKGKA